MKTLPAKAWFNTPPFPDELKVTSPFPRKVWATENRREGEQRKTKTQLSEKTSRSKIVPWRGVGLISQSHLVKCST